MTTPLVYPRTLPSDVLGSRREISREDTFATKLVDYLKIQVYDPQQGGNPYTYVGNDGKPVAEPFRNASDAGLVGNVFLYLPNGLQENYTAMYNETTLGAAGLGALKAAGNPTQDNAVNTLQETAGSLKPEFLMNSISSAIGTVNSTMGAGGDIDGNALSAIATKKIFNPYQEVTFKGVAYRNHTFNFKIAPRNAKEAQEALGIFQLLRYAMHPTMSGSNADAIKKMFELGLTSDDEETRNNATKASNALSTGNGTDVGTLNNARFLNIPNYFRLGIVRVKAQETESGDDLRITGNGGMLKSIHSFPSKVVLENLQLNTSPDNFMNTLRDITDNTWDYGPVAYTMTLTFKETQFLTSDMFARG
tara:strand:- start:331 stop:1419 length:1089 start_codon:yes stop_codon:yes gene_type:complete